MVATASLLAVFGCGGVETDGSEPIGEVAQALTSIIKLPILQGMNPSDVVIGAVTEVYIGDRARVQLTTGTNLGDIANPGIVTNLSNGLYPSTNIGVQAKVARLFSRGSPFLRNYAALGSVYSNEPVTYQDQSTVIVNNQPVQDNLALAEDPTWVRQIVWPSDPGEPIQLEPQNQLTFYDRDPGTYQFAKVERNCVLRLHTGEYYFMGDVTVEPQGTLYVDSSAGPVTLYLTGSFTLRGGEGGANAPGMSAPSLTVITPSIASQVIDSAFTGVFIAPNATINLHSNFGYHRGAFFGHKVAVHQDDIILHMQDPYAFHGFGPSDRVRVSGGSLVRSEPRLPSYVTDDYEQAEAVALHSHAPGGPNVVTVAYNDLSTNEVFDYLQYPEGGKSGEHRWLLEGASLMGWSYSTNGGRSFQYGGKVHAPLDQGISAIWGDPALASAGPADNYVYLANVALPTDAFRSLPKYREAPNRLEDVSPIGANLGYCVARSEDSGITFPDVRCLNLGQGYDGTALAAAIDVNGHHQVYLAGTKTAGSQITVVQMDGESMDFLLLPEPFSGAHTFVGHPRLRQFDGWIYVVAREGTNTTYSLYGNRIDARNGAQNWEGEQLLVDGEVYDRYFPVPDPTRYGYGGRVLRQANPFSFDVGPQAPGDSAPLLRVMYQIEDPVAAGEVSLKTRQCLGLAPCQDTGWSTAGQAGDERLPSLRRDPSTGAWAATWWGHATGSSEVSTLGAFLQEGGGGQLLVPITLAYPVNPCSAGDFGSSYWADYNELEGLNDGTFFAPYTVNGPGCRFQGSWTADMHVGGSIFWPQ